MIPGELRIGVNLERSKIAVAIEHADGKSICIELDEDGARQMAAQIIDAADQIFARRAS